MPYSLYSHRYVLDDVVRLCSHYDEDNDDHVTWDEYSKKTFRVEGLAEMQFKLHVVAHPVDAVIYQHYSNGIWSFLVLSV